MTLARNAISLLEYHAHLPLEQLVALLDTRDAYYWATHAGAELDLLVMWNGKRYGFEIKYADAPGTTKSMHAALGDLGLAHLWVIYPGEKRYNLTDKITVVPARGRAATAATDNSSRATSPAARGSHSLMHVPCPGVLAIAT